MDKKEALKTTFNDLRRALMENDINALGSIIADDYTGFNLSGLIETKDDILKCFGDKSVVVSEYSAEEIEFDIIGDVGIVTGKGFIAVHFQEFDIRHNILFTDIFKYSEGSWKYYRSQATEIHSA